MSRLRNKLPEIVQKYLDETGISQTKLAQEAKINPSTISGMLREEPRRIDLKVVEALHNVIGFGLDEIIVEEE